MSLAWSGNAVDCSWRDGGGGSGAAGATPLSLIPCALHVPSAYLRRRRHTYTQALGTNSTSSVLQGVLHMLYTFCGGRTHPPCRVNSIIHTARTYTHTHTRRHNELASVQRSVCMSNVSLRPCIIHGSTFCGRCIRPTPTKTCTRTTIIPAYMSDK